MSNQDDLAPAGTARTEPPADPSPEVRDLSRRAWVAGGVALLAAITYPLAVAWMLRAAPWEQTARWLRNEASVNSFLPLIFPFVVAVLVDVLGTSFMATASKGKRKAIWFMLVALLALVAAGVHSEIHRQTALPPYMFQSTGAALD